MTVREHHNFSHFEETAKGRPNKIIDPPSWRMIRRDCRSRPVQSFKKWKRVIKGWRRQNVNPTEWERNNLSKVGTPCHRYE